MSQTKSAFSPMKARLNPADAVKSPATPEPEKPIDATRDDADRSHRSSGPALATAAVIPPEIVRIELEILVIRDNEKSNVGFAFQGSNPISKTRAITGVLNRANPLTERALRSNDSKLVAFLWGTLVAEAVILRRKHKAVEAVYQHLREKLNPPGGFVTGIGCALANRLAQPFDKLLIYGPERPDRIPHIAVAGLEVPMAPDIAARPWGKQAETPEGTKP